MPRWLLWIVWLLLLSPLLVFAQDIPAVPALVETAPSPGDGATAPAIWLHPDDPAQSLILGTDDNAGLGVYDLSGALLQFEAQDGALGGVDLRYNFPYAGDSVTLIAAGVKDEAQFVLYTITAAERRLQRLQTIDVGIDVAALCMYRSAVTETYYVFVTNDDGDVEQYRLDGTVAPITATLAREFSVGSETESCTADDALGRFYVAEGEVAVWRYGAEPEAGTTRRIVDLVGGNITEEVEGLTIYGGVDGAGYLIVSNEKNHSFLLYERGGDNPFVGEFAVAASDTLDAVTEPTGMDVVNLPLNDLFPQGLFVTSDDVNSNPNADNNFKLLSWGDIAGLLDLPVDSTFDERAAGATSNPNAPVVVSASVETQPVSAGIDAADDPAIWIHPTDVSRSTIIATDKTPEGGLEVYDLSGARLQFLPVGRLNNVDLRYNVPLGGQPTAVVAASNRTDNSIVLFRVNAETRLLEPIAARAIVSDMQEVYGICMYHSPRSGLYYVFLNSADTGEVEQYELFDNGAGLLDARLVREWSLASQTEGCAADDELGYVYIGEEAVGFWRFAAEPDANTSGVQIDSTAPAGQLAADVEGIAIYYGSAGAGYLLVSSQGSSTFVVYDRALPNAYIGTFSVIEGTVDAVSGTDGIDVTNFPLSPAFPEGLFVAQDDLNIDPVADQNFKLVSWGDIARALNLLIDTRFDPRTVGS